MTKNCELCGKKAEVFPPNSGRPLCRECYEREIENYNEMIPSSMPHMKLKSIFATNS